MSLFWGQVADLTGTKTPGTPLSRDGQPPMESSPGADGALRSGHPFDASYPGELFGRLLSDGAR